MLDLCGVMQGGGRLAAFHAAINAFTAVTQQLGIEPGDSVRLRQLNGQHVLARPKSREFSIGKIQKDNSLPLTSFHTDRTTAMKLAVQVRQKRDVNHRPRAMPIQSRLGWVRSGFGVRGPQFQYSSPRLAINGESTT